ncbi:MAG: PAS domain S-box protein [Planctomycetes bacterium]|nr:PAS domain S-box protein [Planctomycetota bacterium]
MLDIKKSSTRYLTPASIAGIYAVVGFVWIWYSDRLVELIASNQDYLSHLQTYKGSFYVIMTALLLYLLLKKYSIIKAKEHRNIFDILDRLPVAVAICDVTEKITFINRECVNLFGYELEGVGSIWDWFGIAYPDESYREMVAANYRQDLESYAATGEKWPERTYEVRLKDGSKRMVEFSSFIFNNHFMFAMRDVTEENRFKARLMESEERFRLLVETSSDWIWETDERPDAVYTYASPKVMNILGYAPEELVGKSAFSLMNPEEAEKMRREYETLVRNPQPFHGIINVNIHKDGTERVLESSGAPYYDENGVFRGFRGMDRDITERQRVEDELLRIRHAIENANDAIGICDLEGKVLYLNQTFIELTGYDVDGLNAKGGPTGLYTDAARAEEMLATVLSGGEWSGEMAVSRSDGKLVPVLLRASHFADENGKAIGAIGVHTDMTELKNIRREADSAQAFLNAAINAMKDIFFVKDEDHRWVVLNDAACEAIGRAREELIGKRDSELFPENGEEYAETDMIALEKGSHQREVCSEANGKIRHVIITKSRFIDEATGKRYIVGLCNDISERLAMEEKLRHSQKMDSIGQLAGGIAHDFNNMLGGVIGYAELTALKTDDEKIAYYVKNIIDTANQAADLTNKLLAFSRKGKSQPSPVNVHSAIESACTILERSIDRRISLSVRNEAEDCVVLGDYTLIQNAVLNLCINSRDAMPEGGQLDIITANVEIDAATCMNSVFNIKPGRYIKIEVRDNGHGIDEKIMEQIFEPFFTTKEVGKGTGLGLAAVYGTMKDHDGAVMVRSSEGEGSSFELYFPLAEVGESVAEIDSDVDLCGTGTILLADDEEFLRSCSRDILEGLGYSVILSKNGKECVEIFKERQDEIDLVILDVIMPVMNGRDAFHEIVRIKPGTKVLVASGFTKNADIEHLMSDGLCGFIKKPYKRVEIAREIREVFNSQIK